jgi:hypothetical protein
MRGGQKAGATAAIGSTEWRAVARHDPEAGHGVQQFRATRSWS